MKSKGLFAAGLMLFLFVLPSVAGGEQFGLWTLEFRTDEQTQKPGFLLYCRETQPQAKEKASLFLRYKNGRLDLYIVLKEITVYAPIVEIQFDDEASFIDYWGYSSDREALFYNKNIMDLASLMSSHESMLVRYTAYGEKTAVMLFRVQQLAQALRRIKAEDLFMELFPKEPDGYPPAALTQAQRWALALSEIMTACNGDSHEALPFYAGGPGQKNNRQYTLEKDWGVKNRDDLLRVLHRTEEDGHNAALDELKDIITTRDDYSIYTMLNEQQLSERYYFYLKFVLSNWNLYRDRDLIAWDWGRCVNLCRWGYECGYLSEDEA